MTRQVSPGGDNRAGGQSPPAGPRAARGGGPGPDGKRRQPRIGPFSTQKEAKDALTGALGQVRDRRFAADRRTTVREYLRAWLEDQRPSLKPRDLGQL